MSDFFNESDKKSLIDKLIYSLTSLPTVGMKTAERMSYFLLQEHNHNKAIEIATTLKKAIEQIKPCNQCRNLTEHFLCSICQNQKRDESLLCIVESPINLINIEKTGQYFGKYFVLMGLISPIDAIGSKELGLDLLNNLIETRQIKEMILAISASVEGQATSFYLKKIATNHNIKITQLAKGVPVGGELDYIDQQTLALALNERHQF